MPTLVRFTAIRANARRIPGPQIREALREFTMGYCGDIVMEVSQYPPEPPPPNRYRRTGRLLMNWRVRPTGTGAQIQYTIDNPVQDRWGRYYAGFVHGPGGSQTSFHAEHGWKNISDFIDRPKFTAGAQAIISGGVL